MFKTDSSVLRKFAGPEAKELFLALRPESKQGHNLKDQVESVYGSLKEILESEGGSLEDVVKETVFFRCIRDDLDTFLEARDRFCAASSGRKAYQPGSTFVEQAPIDDKPFEISAAAVISGPGSCPHRGAGEVLLGNQRHLHAGNLYGRNGSLFQEALTMFYAAEGVLERYGMNFSDVVRTWIYLRRMERDYDEFNRARREFFQRRNLALPPASTGIQGIPGSEGHSLALSLHAIEGPLKREGMTTPTLNEAWTYGSDFSRGMKLVDANKIMLYISGTASVDERGQTAHPGDIRGQLERMISNISSLLSKQKASFQDVVSAVTYLKEPSHAALLEKMLSERALDGFPNLVVRAPICRADLLCEMEAVAVLPLAQSKNLSTTKLMNNPG